MQKPKGNVLLSIGTRAFLLLRKKTNYTFSKDWRTYPWKDFHSYSWEAIQQAKTFLDLGYCVDIIDATNPYFMPRKKYSFFLDVRTNLERLTPKVGEDCIKIFHPHWTHWMFHNKAVYERLFDIQARRGITLKPRKILPPNLSVECADYITQMGNPFTASTYSYAQKKTFYVRHSSSATFSWMDDKDYQECRKNFLWLGGSGLVCKGLDLVLEAFSKMPNFQLTICGSIDAEKDFKQAFYKELYQTSNIKIYGWVDIHSEAFIKLIRSCIALVFSSCSELSVGCAIMAMHAGLIPIVSHQSDIDVKEDFGIILKTSSIQEIQDSVRYIANLPADRLKQMSYSAWKYARATHTRENYANDFQAAILQMIERSKTRWNGGLI